MKGRVQFTSPKCVMHVSRLIFSDVSGESLFRNSFTAPGSPSFLPTSPGQRPHSGLSVRLGSKQGQSDHRHPRTSGWRGGRRRGRAFRHVWSLTPLSSFIAWVSVFCVFKLCQSVDVEKEMEPFFSRNQSRCSIPMPTSAILRFC